MICGSEPGERKRSPTSCAIKVVPLYSARYRFIWQQAADSGKEDGRAGFRRHFEADCGCRCGMRRDGERTNGPETRRRRLGRVWKTGVRQRVLAGTGRENFTKAPFLLNMDTETARLDGLKTAPCTRRAARPKIKEVAASKKNLRFGVRAPGAVLQWREGKCTHLI